MTPRTKLKKFVPASYTQSKVFFTADDPLIAELRAKSHRRTLRHIRRLEKMVGVKS